MIKRTKLQILCTSLFLATAVAGPAAAGNVYAGMSPVAQESAENVISVLESSGYEIVSVKRTLLRRLRITAANGVHTREVIVSRSTGEIRRDSVFLLAEAPRGGNGDSNGNGGDRTSAVSASDGDKTSKDDSNNVDDGGKTSIGD